MRWPLVVLSAAVFERIVDEAATVKAARILDDHFAVLAGPVRTGEWFTRDLAEGGPGCQSS